MTVISGLRERGKRQKERGRGGERERGRKKGRRGCKSNRVSTCSLVTEPAGTLFFVLSK